MRDVRWRPWPSGQDHSLQAWVTRSKRSLRQVFLSGIEGLPQPRATEFARRWATLCHCRFGLLLPHGTDALRIALASALDHDGLEYGGEVVVPNLSFIASATAALDRRFGVAFVDVDPQTLLLDPDCVERAVIPGRTRAIMAVHLFGQPCDMTALRAVADRHGLALIEDAAQAHGASVESGPAGSLSDAAAFSFQSFKNLGCGEGGALTTNDETIYERAYAFHNAGRALHGSRRWDHYTLGWNCRPTEYQAALLLDRLHSFEHQQGLRARNFHRLREMLADVECVEAIAIRTDVRRHGVHMAALSYRSERCGGLPIVEFLRVAQAEGLPLHRGYECTMSEQPVMKSLATRRPEYIRILPTPVADRAVQSLLYIPHNVFLGRDRDMEEITAGLLKIQKHFQRTSVVTAPVPQLVSQGL